MKWWRAKGSAVKTIELQRLTWADEPYGEPVILELDTGDFYRIDADARTPVGSLSSNRVDLRAHANYSRGQELTSVSGELLAMICQPDGGSAMAIRPGSLEHDWPTYQHSVEVSPSGAYEVLSIEEGCARVMQRGRASGGTAVEHAAAACLLTYGDPTWLQALWESRQDSE